MKTIFISILQGVEAKNILRTGIYETLIAKPDIRLVFLVGSNDRIDYYRREFDNDRVIYEVIPTFKTSPLERIFSFLKFKLINTETMDLRRKIAVQDNKLLIIYYPITFLFNRLFARPFFRKFIRLCDLKFVQSNIFFDMFEKYNPDSVFLAHLFDDVEVSILREAKKRNIPSFGFINSWDKLTARCMMRILPDKLFVYNEIVKKEACLLADMKPENIIVAGIPHYDHYFNNKPRDRDAFCKKAGIDLSKQIILYSPIGKYFSNSDWDIIDLLHSFIANGFVHIPAELLVRFQPNDFVDDAEIQKRPWLKYCWPGVRFSAKRGVDWDMGQEDLKYLHDTLFHSSLLICYAASISVDIAVFDKPVININFEVKKKAKFSQTPTYFYNMSHYKKALSTGGIKLASSKEDLLFWINNYLDNPLIDQKERCKLVSQQCWKLDGKAGERIALKILSYV